MGLSQKQIDAMHAVRQMLTDHGWTRDGQTQSDTVRMATTTSPVYGGIGGEIRTFGGRERWRKGQTRFFCTIGPRTVCVYSMMKGTFCALLNCPTKEPDRVLDCLRAVGRRIAEGT